MWITKNLCSVHENGVVQNIIERHFMIQHPWMVMDIFCTAEEMTLVMVMNHVVIWLIIKVLFI